MSVRFINLTAQEFYAKVYSDTKAQYWSNGFLELEELKNDELNTQRAFQAIEATLVMDSGASLDRITQ
mgnify:CR=1 FL=1